jgi:hypothetical protein
MNKLFTFSTLIVLLLTISACSVARSTLIPVGSSVVPTLGTPEKATATPLPQPAPTESLVGRLVNSCGLLNNRDLASFFTSHAEVILPTPQISQVGHPIFSTGNAPGTETSCVYYTFHLPGSIKEIVLQVNYWVDVPASGTPGQAWVQDWTQANSKAMQTISGIADGAFTKDGQLIFKKGDMYVTIAATETDWNLKVSTDMGKQLAVEKQVALDILKRLG